MTIYITLFNIFIIFQNKGTVADANPGDVPTTTHATGAGTH